MPLLTLLICTGLVAEAAPLSVFTTLPPHADLVRRIGGEEVQVTALLSTGETPHTFSHTPRQIQALSECQFLFIAGTLPVERRLLAKLPANRVGGRVIDLSQGIALRDLEEHDHDEDAHGHGDPHIWLGPRELLAQAERIVQVLSEALPEQADAFAARQKEFEQQLSEADRRAKATLAPYRGKPVLVFHPAFGYFLDAYGLKQAIVETHGKAPTPKQVRNTIKTAKAQGVKIIFVQPGFDQKAARVIAKAIDGEVVLVDPLPNDVLANYYSLTEKFASAFQ